MSSINKVIIVGRLGANPEVRQFDNGSAVTNISVATSEKWTDKNTGEKKEQTEWHHISLFNRLGEIAAQYLAKGSMVYIEGSLRTRKYTDKQGVERYSTEVRASELRMLGNADNQNRQGGYQNGGYQNGGYTNQGQAHPPQAQNGYPPNQGYAPQPNNPPQNHQQQPLQGMGHSLYQPMGSYAQVQDDNVPF